jgi:long-chain acyl-CoA synthetase
MEHRSIAELFGHVRRSRAGEVAYRYKSGGEWHDVTWAEHAATVMAVAKSLVALGIGRGERVCILGQTRLEWVQSDFGIAIAGGVTIGIYPANLAPDCGYVIEHSDARGIFVENDEQLEKVLAVRSRTPSLRHIVRWDGTGDAAAGVLGWREFLELGDSTPDAAVEQRSAALGPDDLAALVYTSGTTGVPKGAMITHRNLLFASESATRSLHLEQGYITLLFLPLAHVFAKLIVFLCMQNGIIVAFAESISRVADNLKEVRPHFLASVPRIYEKVHDKITSGVEEAGGVKKRLFEWALSVGREVGELRQHGRPVPGLLKVKHRVATRLVFRKIQAALGGRLVYAISGAAPLNKEIAEFFGACGVLILEGLGMTENTSFTNVNRFDHNKFGTVGPPGPGIEMKLAKDGEILFRGPNVMKGYFKDPAATAEAIDSEGWLHTGDIGEIDEDGFLRITDRKKDLIVTAGGKNVAPQRIERILRTSHYISHAVAIGDKRKFIGALVTLDPDAVPEWATAKGIVFASLAELASHPQVVELIESEVRDRNQQLASFESVKKFRILPRDLSIETGELTATGKIKRKVVLEEYRDLVEEMYA